MLSRTLQITIVTSGIVVYEFMTARVRPLDYSKENFDQLFISESVELYIFEQIFKLILNWNWVFKDFH